MASLEFRMTNTHLAPNTRLILKDVSYVLPDGKTLFTGLNEQFDNRATGLVGRNGVGKTVLARLLAGQLEPTRGVCQRTSNMHYLAQQVAPPANATVADLAGVQQKLEALTRIECGSTAPEDFDTVGDDWNLPQQLNNELERNGLSRLMATTPAHTLSGGEAMRVSLIGATLSDAEFLILDEPSNHLDRPHRQALIEQLQHWKGGLIVVSHDRQLLESMERIVELSSLGLNSYGGNYSFYAETKSYEQKNALQNLNKLKLERQRQEQTMRKQRERQERRQARGNRQGKETNQAKILLDRQKERSEISAGALRQQQTNNRAALNQRIKNAWQQVEEESSITLHEIPMTQNTRRRTAELNDVELPFVTGTTRHISLGLHGQQRIGVVGANGCGKSTLLRVLARHITHLSGDCIVTPNIAYLDQRLANLVPEKTVLEQLQQSNRNVSEGETRMRLAQLGLDTQKITTPSGLLSGGERLKGALACILYKETPPQLLLLDEPSNHLDLPSVQALETLLRGYRGTLVVVSHDETFLDNLELTDRLIATEAGWCLKPI